MYPQNCEACTYVSEELVLSVIKSFACKSDPLDPWPAFLFTEYIDLLIKPITKFINLLLSGEVFPHQLKEAIITSLIKNPSLCKEELSNYWLVSNFSGGLFNHQLGPLCCLWHNRP